MKERPILFSGDMVRALLDGRKTQTRRIVKQQPVEQSGWVGGAYWERRPARGMQPADQWCIRDMLQFCPHGQSGDRLWVRENLKYVDTPTTRHDHVLYAADGVRVPRDPGLVDWACDGMAYGFANSVPSIHMPRWASRITLEVTDVRVERLQAISAADARAEGIEFQEHRIAGDVCRSWKAYGSANGWYPEGVDTAPIFSYRSLWDALNATRGYGWDANPYVWVIEFRRNES